MTKLDLDALHAELIETLQGIVNANWREWAELASSEEFERWAKSRANHAIDRLRKAEAASKWQPIETAPKDGTHVLLWATRHSMLAPHPEFIVGAYRNGWWSGPSTLSHVTHWMPLPAAPTSADSDKQPEKCCICGGTAVQGTAGIGPMCDHHWNEFKQWRAEKSSADSEGAKG